MPNWQPNWSNVQWDSGAAYAAARALREMAEQMDRALSTRLNVAGDAQVDFLGLNRTLFDSRLQEMQANSHRLAHDLRQAASDIEMNTRRAEAEQQWREEERRRWEDERRREEEERRRRSSD